MQRSEWELAKTRKFRADTNDKQNERRASREQTKLTKRLDNEPLQIDEPDGKKKHKNDLNAE